MQCHPAGRRLVVLAVLVCARIAAAAPDVRYRDGRATVHVHDAPVAGVLDAIARDAGATVRGDMPTRDVTLDLDDVPLGDVLARLLGKDSFALTYGPDGGLRTIELLTVGKLVPAWPPPGVDASAGVAPERQAEVMGRRVDVSGRLATVLGTRRPTAGELIHAALRAKDDRARADAQRRALAAFDADPELEEVFTRTLAAIDDRTLASIFRDWSGTRAREFVATLAAQAHSPELRTKAAAVLRQLDAPAPDAG
ncbi:MAG TPA: hypothetical protein VKU61_14045 [Candidatus Binatia bacterium]|nr:hypothetical protein [Candidatus Binatia bacterium]